MKKAVIKFVAMSIAAYPEGVAQHIVIDGVKITTSETRTFQDIELARQGKCNVQFKAPANSEEQNLALINAFASPNMISMQRDMINSEWTVSCIADVVQTIDTGNADTP